MLDKPCEILVVEDNPGDVVLIQEAFREGKLCNCLNVAGDGEEAVMYLRREGRFADAKRPDLILLDLNLPKKDGREVLHEIKNDPELCDIPVLILTTSVDDRDIHQAYKLHANCYLNKPVDIDDFMSTVRSIDEFWLTLVRLPARQRAAAL